jgi:hypothetical protein
VVVAAVIFAGEALMAVLVLVLRLLRQMQVIKREKEGRIGIVLLTIAIAYMYRMV